MRIEGYMSKKTFRKSWVTYVPMVVMLAIEVVGALLLTIVYPSWLQGLAELMESESMQMWLESTTLPVGLIFAVVIFGLSIVRTVLVMISNASHKIEVSASDVQYSGHVLPWRKQTSTWRGDQIFRCGFAYPMGFLSWLFGFGAVVIADKAGTTMQFRLGGMHRPKLLSSMINELAERHR